MGGVIGGALVLAAAAAIANPTATPSPTATSTGREDRFLDLLRTYPQRPPQDTLAQVARLVDEGSFPERDRAEYWLGSAKLALGDLTGARAWFARLANDHPGSVWVERSWLGLGDAAAQEHRFGLALDWYRKSQSAQDASVREMGRVSMAPALVLRARQRWAWAAGAFALLVAVLLGVSLLGRAPVCLWPLPAEARIVLPVLAVLALLSARQDPAPRLAILELCTGGGLLVTLSGLRLRAVQPRGAARALHAAGTLAALAALAYVAVYRGDLVGMVLETLRAGAE